MRVERPYRCHTCRTLFHHEQKGKPYPPCPVCGGATFYDFKEAKVAVQYHPTKGGSK